MTFRWILAVLLLAVSSIYAQPRPGKSTAPPKPAEDAQLYRNSRFGFRYHIPYGWVDRTKDLQEKDEQPGGSSTAPPGKGDTGGGEVLLAVFERPPQAAGDNVNSAVVIASENTESYPGIKTAEDYLGPLNEITTTKGFKSDGDPQEVTIGSRSLVRADYSKALNDKLMMYQSTLVMLEKKRILSFTFIAGNKDEVNDLIDRIEFKSEGQREHR
jgi:hypothetical protein